MEATLIKSIVVHEVKHIVGTILADQISALEKSMTEEEKSIHDTLVTIFREELQKETTQEELHQKAHTIISATLISLASVVEPIELQESQPYSLIESMKNAYLSIRSLF